MVGDHHGEDDDDGDEDEDGEDDGGKVADYSGLAPSVHCSRRLHVRSGRRKNIYAPFIRIKEKVAPFKHPPFHVSKRKSSMALK